MGLKSQHKGVLGSAFLLGHFIFLFNEEIILNKLLRCQPVYFKTSSEQAETQQPCKTTLNYWAMAKGPAPAKRGDGSRTQRDCSLTRGLNLQPG